MLVGLGLKLGQEFQESLTKNLHDTEDDQYLGRARRILDECAFWLTILGLSLREFIHEYKHQALVLFKCCLLQPKVTGPRRETFGCLLKSVDALLRFPL